MTYVQASEAGVDREARLVPFTNPLPIFDRLVKVYGYDLVFRSGFEDHFNRIAIDQVRDYLLEKIDTE